MITLNTISAERYTHETIATHSPQVIVGTAYVRADYPEILVIAVPFTIDGQAYSMDVWEEASGLYGEW